MNLTTFFEELEGLAVNKGLRLMMTRSPLGCGFFFYFVDPDTRRNSHDVLWMPRKDSVDEFISELSISADELIHRIKTQENVN